MIELVKRLSANLLVLEYSRPSGGPSSRDMWATVKLRKTTKCGECGLPLAAGAEAFSPITNGVHRGVRLCRSCATGRT